MVGVGHSFLKSALNVNMTVKIFQGSSQKASDGASEGGEPVVNVEGQMYADNKSYVMVEISVNRPLVPKRQPEELAKKYKYFVFS